MKRYIALTFILMVLIVLSACKKDEAPSENSQNEPASETSAIAESTAQAEEIVPYDPTDGLDEGDPDIGHEYFLDPNRGNCLACHNLDGEGESSGWALDDTGLRREPEWLARYLDNPRNLRPEVARMPPYRGDSQGATIADIVAYLMTLQAEVEHPDSEYVLPEGDPETWEGGIGEYTGNHGGY